MSVNDDAARRDMWAGRAHEQGTEVCSSGRDSAPLFTHPVSCLFGGLAVARFGVGFGELSLANHPGARCRYDKGSRKADVNRHQAAISPDTTRPR